MAENFIHTLPTSRPAERGVLLTSLGLKEGGRDGLDRHQPLLRPGGGPASPMLELTHNHDQPSPTIMATVRPCALQSTN